jgi:hypothetical protein
MQKWEVYRVYCDFLQRPHDKFCICICPVRRWFLFVNSDPPAFRRAREVAVSLEAFEAIFLRKQSFIDTTKLQAFEPGQLAEALADPDRNHGPISPMLRERIRGAVMLHEALTDEQKAQILND